MAFEGILITEIFRSFQGETSLSGVPFTFVRLTGCNLRCSYCDTEYAFKGGRRMPIEAVLAEVERLAEREVLLTGGEPLLQRNTLALAKALHAQGYRVSVETHGEVDVSAFAPFCRLIMDVKTPGSGECRGGFMKNLPHLQSKDEVKFVLTSRGDYYWARNLIRQTEFGAGTLLFSPVMARFGELQDSNFPKWVAERSLEDRLPVRLQLQLHKLIWGAAQTGV